MQLHSFSVHLLTGIALAALVPHSQQKSVPIPNVRSGHAELRQQGRLTLLELAPPNAPLQRIPLTHPSDYRQGTNAPYDAELVAESPNHFLIFTDSFSSNPANITGHCGADPDGERFVHVVALGAFPHETLSTLVASCLLVIMPTEGSPEWKSRTDSAGFSGKLTISFDSQSQPTIVYYVAPDGAVTRPETQANP